MKRPASMREITGNITTSRAPLMIALRFILILSIILMGVVRLRVVARKMVNDEPYQKDIFHEYLMAEALLHGDNPYLPLEQLVNMYVGELPYYPHPSPHPPFVAILFLPLIFFPDNFDIVWLVCELLFIVLISILVTHWARGKVDYKWVVFLSFLLLAWLPVQFDLDYGQLSILLLLLLTGSWLYIQQKNSILTGILIGLSIAIKLITLPILLYFMLKRDWRAVVSTGVTFLGLNLITAAVIGFRPVLQFYTHLSSATYPYYRGYAFNYSAWSIGWRLFDGTGSLLSGENSSPPLILSPELAVLTSFLIPLIILVFGLIYAYRIKDKEISFAIMVCISVIVSPISWLHYHTMLAIPIAVAIRSIVRKEFPTIGTIVLISYLLLTFFVNEHIPGLITRLAAPIAVKQNGYDIPFLVSLLNWIPILEVIGLAVLLIDLGISGGKKQAGCTNR